MNQEPKTEKETPEPGSTQEMRRWIDIVKRYRDKVFPPGPPKV